MLFIKSPALGPRVNWLAAALLSVTLAGCSQFGGLGKPAPGQRPAAQAPADETQGVAGADPTLTPNPYLANPVDAPRQAQALFGQALAALRAEQWQKAEVLLQELTVEHPTLSGPWLNLGIVYHHTERLPQAEEALNQAIAANGKNLDAYNQLAVIKRHQGDFAAAEKLYLQALDVWPQHAASHRNLGILYDLYLGQFDKALGHFESYQQLQAQPDRQITGWIADLKRRLQNVAQVEGR
ncbi:tetratricopeptide repeat protein [Exilibacterium tricleocarpae]|nr:tetratricopeptide repeat protein [Exilibacterium tricleocarpae]